eukprot:scaffold12272_cov65-Phaeocystis_antarctica.AAC.1
MAVVSSADLCRFRPSSLAFFSRFFKARGPCPWPSSALWTPLTCLRGAAASAAGSTEAAFLEGAFTSAPSPCLWPSSRVCLCPWPSAM